MCKTTGVGSTGDERRWVVPRSGGRARGGSMVRGEPGGPRARQDALERQAIYQTGNWRGMLGIEHVCNLLCFLPKFPRNLAHQLGPGATRAGLREGWALPGGARLLQCDVTQPRSQPATNIYVRYFGILQLWVVLKAHLTQTLLIKVIV